MTDSQQTTSQALPPHAQLIEMGIAYWVSGVVHAPAKLELANQLALRTRAPPNWPAPWACTRPRYIA